MSYKYFENRECEYYPCHKKTDRINCLFCFCPLYGKEDCGGSYVITKDGIKDCSDCIFPHIEKNYSEIIRRLSE